MRTNDRIRTIWLALAVALALAGTPQEGKAASAAEINAGVNETLRKFYRQVGGSRQLADKAAAILVFPSVVKAGLGVGGEYGEGALRIGGKTVAYYNTISASIGFQLGAQVRSVIIVFMTKEALESFRKKNGWKVGVDGSVALITVGVGGSIDTNKITKPIIGFILGSKGLMYNLTLEGSKISRIRR
jgi:lipid-binding SYLF domain-containing protein